MNVILIDKKIEIHNKKKDKTIYETKKINKFALLKITLKQQ